MQRSIPRQLSICGKVSISDRQGTTPPIKSLLIAEASICISQQLEMSFINVAQLEGEIGRWK